MYLLEIELVCDHLELGCVFSFFSRDVSHDVYVYFGFVIVI